MTNTTWYESATNARPTTGTARPSPAAGFRPGMALGLGAIIAATLAFVTGGCATGTPPPEVTEARYDGPAISIEESAGQWLAVVRPDSPGWRITLDRRAEGYGFEGVYLTIQEPNPAFSYPLVAVEQRLALNVDAKRPVKVFARLLSFDGESASGEAYVPTPAASSPR